MMFGAMRVAASGIGTQQSFAFGELAAYNPANHTGQFNLPAHPDPLTGEPTVTGFIQLGTPHVGANGSGAQFPPKIGAQAVIMFVDSRQQFPIFSQWYYNSVETPPFPSGTSWGWSDPNGSSVTTTNDGATLGDGVGAVKSVGKGYHLTGTVAGQQTVHNAATAEIAQLATHVNLGDIQANMTSVNAVFAQTHISGYDSALQTAKLNDYITFANLLHTAGAVTAPQLVTILAALVAGWTHGTIIPSGSSVANVKA